MLTSNGFNLVGYLFNAVMNAASTLLIDLVPSQGSSITACVSSPSFTIPSCYDLQCVIICLPDSSFIGRSCIQNNFIRCFLGAAVISVISIILDAVKPGWTHVILAGLCIMVCPLLYAEMKWGPLWRERRRKRMALRES